jgi:hypothetical protein
MKYTGFVLFLGILLITAGCMSEDQSSVGTSTSQGGSAATLVTPATEMIPGQDPIIGVWRISNSQGYDDRFRFNADGSFVESFFNVKPAITQIHSGTWSVQAENSYVVHDSTTGESRTYLYDPVKKTIHSSAMPHLILASYTGDIAAGIAFTTIIPTKTVAPTTLTTPAGPAVPTPIKLSGIGSKMVYFETKEPGEVKFKIYYNISEGEYLKCTDDVALFRLAGTYNDNTLYYGPVYKLHDGIHTLNLLFPGRYSITVKGCWGWNIVIDNV